MIVRLVLPAVLLLSGAATAAGQAPAGGTESSCLFDAAPGLRACEHHSAVFRSANPATGYAQVRDYSTTSSFGPSWNLGADGGWRVQKNQDGQSIFAARGIHQFLNGDIACHAVGDCALFYGWGYSDGGIAAQADEGVTLATLDGGETNGYFHGEVVTGGPGAREPVLRFRSGNRWTTDGAFLLDISKGTLSGYLHGYSTSLEEFKPWLNYLPTTGLKLPLTTAWGEVLHKPGKDHAIENPGTTADAGKAVRVTVRLGAVGQTTKPLVGSTVVCVAGSEYPEQARLLDAGPARDGLQDVTLEVRNPNKAAVIFQGGICGQFISFDANLKTSGYRTSYYAFGSLTGSDLIYGNNLTGGLGNAPIPDPSGSEAETNEGPNAGFHLYPGAEIVMNRSLGAEPALEPNNVVWDPGDVVENPHYPHFGGSGLWVNWTQNSPTSGAYKSQAIHVDLVGAGISGAFRPVMIYNANPGSMYRAGGGLLSAPSLLVAGGAFGDMLALEQGPQPSALGGNAVISIRKTAGNDNQAFNLFDLMRNGREHGSQIRYDPGRAETTFDFVRANGYVSAPVMVTSAGTPASSTVSCVPNSSWDDDDYHYHCLSSGKSIKRVQLSSF